MQQDKFKLMLVPFRHQFLDIYLPHIKLGFMYVTMAGDPVEYHHLGWILDDQLSTPMEHLLGSQFVLNGLLPDYNSLRIDSSQMQQPRRYNLTGGSDDQAPDLEFMVGGTSVPENVYCVAIVKTT